MLGRGSPSAVTRRVTPTRYDTIRPSDGKPNEQFLADLNDPQRERCFTARWPLLILAGAGRQDTGITYRVAHLLAPASIPVNPGSDIHQQGAGEMKSRVRQLTGATADSVWVSTFHSFAASSCVSSIRRGLPQDSRFTMRRFERIIKRLIAT